MRPTAAEGMTRILLDTDLAMGTPGSDIDDGFALALALADPELAVDLVTTVSGNTDVGAGRPLHGPRREPARTVTQAGSASRAADPGYAAVHIVERVMAEPGVFTVVAIGPLTNLALALASGELDA